MSFGFSVGDFIAVGNLIKNICSCLEDAGGAKEEYQGLLRELDCLQQALQHLDKLQHRSSSSPTTLDSIKYAALSCRRPLEQFLGKIKKYDKSLGVWGKEGVIVRTAKKLKWGFGEKQEIRKLQNYLNIHIGTINILLAEHGLEKMDLASDKAAADQLDIRERLDNTRGIIDTISGNMAVQAMVVEKTQQTTTRLLDMISGEFRTSWRSLGEMVAKIFVSTQQTYAVMLEIKGSLAGPDARWSFFQAPLVVEDALGYKFPVPSEYDFDLLDAVVKQKFKTGPGSLDVDFGNYEYFKTKNSNEVLSKQTRIVPGTAITMAIIMIQPTLTDEVCPMPGCGSTQTSKCAGGGRICCECKVWFSPTKKRRRSFDEATSEGSVEPESLENGDRTMSSGGIMKRLKTTHTENNMGIFKNVRFSRQKRGEVMKRKLEEKYVKDRAEREAEEEDTSKHYLRRVRRIQREARERHSHTHPVNARELSLPEASTKPNCKVFEAEFAVSATKYEIGDMIRNQTDRIHIVRRVNENNTYDLELPDEMAEGNPTPQTSLTRVPEKKLISVDDADYMRTIDEVLKRQLAQPNA